MKTDRSRASRRRTRAPRLAPEARRAQLVDSATRVFARRGIGAVHHTQVAREAGVALSTTFAYFRTREDLVAAVLESVENLYLELAERFHDSGRPAPQILLDHTRGFAASVDEHPDQTRVWLNWSSAVGGDHWLRYRALEEQVVSVIERTIARGQREGDIDGSVAPKEGARLVIGSAYLIAQMKLSGRDEDEVSAFVDSLIRVLAGGLARGLPPAPQLG